MRTRIEKKTLVTMATSTKTQQLVEMITLDWALGIDEINGH